MEQGMERHKYKIAIMLSLQMYSMRTKISNIVLCTGNLLRVVLGASAIKKKKQTKYVRYI
jgi:hypothetical protein